MFDLHSDLKNFFDDYVKLSPIDEKKLAEYRDINLERIKSGLDKLGQEDGVTYRYFDRNRNQGGYAMRTLNQHDDNDYDIDVALIFKKEHLPGDSLGSRERIASALKKVGTNFSKEPEARTNAVTVWYADGYHIDFAIYREFADDFGRNVIEHGGADWAQRDPMEITNWFESEVMRKSPTQSSGAIVVDQQLRRIVSLLKKFSRSRESWSMPGGLIISTLAAECYRADRNRDDVALYETISAMVSRLSVSDVVRNPVDFSQLLTNKDKYTKQVKRFKKQLAQAKRKLDILLDPKCTLVSARSAWHWIFQHEFWEEKFQKSTLAKDNAAVSAYSVISKNGHFRLKAEVSKRNAGAILYRYPNGGPPIPKGMWLKFSAEPTGGISGDYWWEVRNFGDEAEEKPDPGHRVEHHNETTWESTAYKGSHQMICELRIGEVVLDEAVFTVRIGER